MRFLQKMAFAFGSAALVLFAVPAHAAIVFNYNDFASCVGLQINGNAACTGGVLRVTPANFGQSGSAFSTTQIPLGTAASFSTFFSFRITGSAFGGADGIVFVIQPVASTLGGAGGGIGYAGIPTSLGVEFDTWDNGPGSGDANASHVDIDLNGSVNSVQTAPVAPALDDGNVWYAWVDYDGATLELRLSQAPTRPAGAVLTRAVNLSSILGTTSAFVGFTSGTGAAFANHDILTWRFDNAFNPIGGPPAGAPTQPIPTLSDAALLLLACLAAVIGLLTLQGRRRA